MYKVYVYTYEYYNFELILLKCQKPSWPMNKVYSTIHICPISYIGINPPPPGGGHYSKVQDVHISYLRAVIVLCYISYKPFGKWTALPMNHNVCLCLCPSPPLPSPVCLLVGLSKKKNLSEFWVNVVFFYILKPLPYPSSIFMVEYQNILYLAQ